MEAHAPGCQLAGLHRNQASQEAKYHHCTKTHHRNALHFINPCRAIQTVGSDLLLKRYLQSSDPEAWITFRAVVRSIVHKPGQTQINRRGWPSDISRGVGDARNFTSLCYKLPAKKSQRLSRG